MLSGAVPAPGEVDDTLSLNGIKIEDIAHTFCFLTVAPSFILPAHHFPQSLKGLLNLPKYCTYLLLSSDKRIAEIFATFLAISIFRNIYPIKPFNTYYKDGKLQIQMKAGVTDKDKYNLRARSLTP